VAQQVLHRGLLLDRFQPLRGGHLLVGKFGQPTADRIGEQQLPTLNQHHDRHRNDRLGHRINAEDAVDLHGCARGRVLLAHGLQQADLPAPRDHGHSPRQPAAVDFMSQHIHQALRALGAQAHISRVGVGQSGVWCHLCVLRVEQVCTPATRSGVSPAAQTSDRLVADASIGSTFALCERC
jgi:hypothetical protein